MQLCNDIAELGQDPGKARADLQALELFYRYVHSDRRFSVRQRMSAKLLIRKQMRACQAHLS